jgi:hypothetical protein
MQRVYELQQAGHPPHVIADMLRHEFGYNALQAARLSHAWSQRDAADAWNQQWPDDPKTFKSISYWETWFDSPKTGYSPNLTVLDRLAQLCQCNVRDLLTGYGEHRPTTTTAEPATHEPPHTAADAALTRARTLHAEVVNRWPHAFTALDTIRAEPPGPWPDWCLIPTTATALVLGQPAPVEAVTALYAWRHTRSVYLYPPELALDIARKPPTHLHHTDPSLLLPEWCLYIAAGSGPCPATGVWAYLEHRPDRPEGHLRLLLDPGHGGLDDLIPIAIPLHQPLTDTIHDILTGTDPAAAAHATALDKTVALAVYPGSPDATMATLRGIQRRPLRGCYPATRETVWVIAARQPHPAADPTLVAWPDDRGRPGGAGAVPPGSVDEPRIRDTPTKDDIGEP